MSQGQRAAAVCAIAMLMAHAPAWAEGEVAFLTAPAYSASAALTELPLALILNGEPRGDVFVRQGDDGDLLIRTNALADRGIPELHGKVYSIDSRAYVSLHSIDGARFELDEKNLTLRLTLPPEYFGAQSASLANETAKSERTEETSAFLNYRLGWSSGDNVASTATLATEAAGRTGPYLLRSEQLYRHSDVESSFVRFQTQLMYDRRDDAQRWAVGDSFTSSGELGSTLNLGGVSLSKVYQMTPYYIRYPTANLSGAATLPSDVEVYVGDTRVYQDHVGPGAFQLSNLNYYGGRQDLRVVVRDALGQEQVYAYPFYFSTAALGKGVQEYSYGAGWLREDYGIQSNRYGPFALSGLHRYGYNDYVTLGFRGEYASQRANLGPLVAFRTPLGSLSVAVAESRDGAQGASGTAAASAYAYQYGSFNARAGFRSESASYAVADPAASLRRVQAESLVGAGYGTALLGSLDLQYSDSRLWGAPDQQVLQIGYSHPVLWRGSLFGNVRRQLNAPQETDIFVGFSMSLGPLQNVGAFHTHASGVQSDVVQASGSPGPGEGLGYRLVAQRNQEAGVETNQYSPYVEYDARYATLIAQDTSMSSQTGTSSNQWQAAVQGSMETVRHTLAFGRRVDDSFAIAQLEPPLQGVRVYYNNQEIGRTDAKGQLLVQSVGSFLDNPIAIEDKDVPIEYNLAQASRIISPPYRSGSLVRFKMRHDVGIAGKMLVKAGKSSKPLEFREGRMQAGDTALSFPIGTAGEFYIENAPSGRYQGTVEMDGKDCRFTIEIPATAEPVTELDQPVVCEIAR